jgi:hypothetical protein
MIHLPKNKKGKLIELEENNEYSKWKTSNGI